MEEYSREDILASIEAKLALSREFKPHILGGRRVVSC